MVGLGDRLAHLYKHLGQLSGAEAKVAVAMLHHGGRNGSCWASLARVADVTGLSRRQVVRAVRRLHDLDLVRSKHTPGRPAMRVVMPRAFEGEVRQTPRPDGDGPSTDPHGDTNVSSDAYVGANGRDVHVTSDATVPTDARDTCVTGDANVPNQGRPRPYLGTPTSLPGDSDVPTKRGETPWVGTPTSPTRDMGVPRTDPLTDSSPPTRTVVPPTGTAPVDRNREEGGGRSAPLEEGGASASPTVRDLTGGADPTPAASTEAHAKIVDALTRHAFRAGSSTGAEQRDAKAREWLEHELTLEDLEAERRACGTARSPAAAFAARLGDVPGIATRLRASRPMPTDGRPRYTASGADELGQVVDVSGELGEMLALAREAGVKLGTRRATTVLGELRSAGVSLDGMRELVKWAPSVGELTAAICSTERALRVLGESGEREVAVG